MRPIARSGAMFVTTLAAALAAAAAYAQDYSASLAAVPTEYTGACPTTIKFNGAITARRAGRVQYRFVRSDGATAPIQTLDFATPGTKPVGITWTLGGPTLPTYSGWEAVRIVYPTLLESNKAGFSIKCASAPAGRGVPPPPYVVMPGEPPPPPTVVRGRGQQPPPPTVFRQAGDPPPPPAVVRQGGEQLPNDLAQAHAQIRRLQGENQRLHDENQRLRAFIKDANAHMARQQRSSPPARVDDRRQPSAPPAPPVPGVSCPGPTGRLDPMCHVPGACNVLPHCRL